MPPRPTLDEITAFLADLKALCTIGGCPAGLADRKADLLERIADTMPGDKEAADVAHAARVAADEARER
ncbi:hypothetical protein F7R91_40470 [Streptomyces luteolifulvus]|uniref:Uncharacterized protein n=1 Tax=Streptomyces luteolifulvus TaxID=2615112 RepID=A0A643JPP6_9ACTN|nr:hypothetical protein [Streptomyces luteolifulvus]KAB1139309.1 hypothetical protein F7R91_40470 [Streptomyces luteolifulvus]